MVPPDSRQISRARRYLGSHSGDRMFSSTGISPSTSRLSRTVRLTHDFLTPRTLGRRFRMVPQPRTRNACRLSHAYGLASSAFARHYSRNHGCFLFLWVLRCFTSPRSLYPPYIFRRESPGHLAGLAGFPHSDILGSQFVYQLPEAYRRLLRPSSALHAKAFTVCS